MSKFLSGRQSNLKLGVAGYTESKTVLETTGKVGIGTTDAQSYSLFVVGDTNVTGLVSATAFYGDGSNLENTGATLSAAAGTQRLVVTSLTSGTMVDAATDSDLTYNATTDTLNANNLIVAGNLTVNGTETVLNTTSLEVEDINIGIASANPKLTDAQLNGAGITIHGLNGDKTLTWDNSNSRLGFNTDLYAPNFFVGDITASGDVDIDGHTELDNLRVSGVSTFNSQINLNAHLDMGSNDFIKVGDGDELLIYFDSLDTQIFNTGGGYLNITNSNERVNIRAVYNEDGIVVKPNGSVELYYDNSKKFETTSYGAKIYNDLQVGTGVTIYGNAGIVSAISFYGDGSNLTNTGATLSATSGTERLVTTQLTSGTMVDAATDADLTFNATTNLLHTPKIDAAGLSPDGTTFGTSGYVPVADGSGGWNWGTLQGASSVNTILNGFTVSEEGVVVGTAGSITQLDFRGVNILASANPQPSGIATITMSETPTFQTINLTGISTFGGQISVGGTTGTDGQYLESTGVGVTWKSFPSLRITQTFSASAGQTIFPFNYNVNFLDVFVNGVKLSTSEYVGTSGTSVVLNTPAFTDEIVELHSYNITSNYSTGPVSVLDDLTDVTIGTLADDQLIQYNINSGQWENVSAATVVGAASSFATKVSTATTATAGQTTFSGTYTVGFVDVFLNGVKQSEDQYTATTGTNIVFNEGASEDDIVEVVGLTANIPAPGSGSYLNSDVDNHLNVGTASTGQILSWNGSDYAWVADQSGGSSYTNSDVDSHINVSGATSGQILSWNGSDYAWVADQSGGGSIAGIDTTATSYFNNIDASGTITANTFSGITTSMISDYGNGLSGGGGISAVGIQSGGVLVGSASTINFTTGTVTVSNDVATVSVGSSIRFVGARLYHNDYAPPTAAAWTEVTNWDGTSIDTHSFVDSSNGFTIPAGVSKIRLTMGGRPSAGVSNQWTVVKNGSFLQVNDGGIFVEAESATGYNNGSVTGTTAVLSVTQGDTFDLRHYLSSTTPTWDLFFEIEVIEGDILGDYFAGGGGSGISLTDLSVTTANTPLQLGALAYNNSNGVFTFTPPDIVGQARPAFSVGTANNPLQLGAISYNSSNGEFKYTPPDLSSYQQKTGDGSALTGIVTSIVAGTNVTVSNTGGTYTINSSGGSSGPDPVMMGMIF